MREVNARQAKGRQNKFGGDTGDFPIRGRGEAQPTNAHRRPCSGFNIGWSRLQLRPKPVCGRVCRPIGGSVANGEQKSISRISACFFFFQRRSRAQSVPS